MSLCCELVFLRNNLTLNIPTRRRSFGCRRQTAFSRAARDCRHHKVLSDASSSLWTRRDACAPGPRPRAECARGVTLASAERAGTEETGITESGQRVYSHT